MTILHPRPAPYTGHALPRVDHITHLPILILFPHSRCNCRCVMCDIWRSTTKSELSANDIAKWTEEWRELRVERVVLSGGEALMHSRLWELCDHLRAADIAITILSTGLLLQRHADDLVRRCDDVVVSLDGPEAIHDRIRNIPRAFERLVSGVQAVRDAAARAGANVAVSGRCTIQRANFHAMRATVDAAHEIGLDRISFLAADVSTDAFNRPAGWDEERVEEVALHATDLPLLDAELDALEREYSADFASGYLAESPEKLRIRLARYYAALLGTGDFAPNDCNAPWVSSVIESDGAVRPCFFQPPLGNVHEAGGLMTVLNSPSAVAWRQGLDVARNAICRKCVCTLSLSTASDP